jgi:hypothetical protein
VWETIAFFVSDGSVRFFNKKRDAEQKGSSLDDES